MFSILKRRFKSYGSVLPLTVDMHSHVLPKLDDGSESYDQSIRMIQEFIRLGYKKIITTPHIMGDFYKNTPEGILDTLDKLRDICKEMGLEIELEAAAEYYLDDHFLSLLEKNAPLLCFGEKKYVLFETSYINPSPYLEQTIFSLLSQGYTPILAHPERYTYLFENYKILPELHEKGVLFQVNGNSFAGYYSKASKKLAEKLVSDRLVDFIASDAHAEKHLRIFEKARESSHFIQALEQGVLNYSL